MILFRITATHEGVVIFGMQASSPLLILLDAEFFDWTKLGTGVETGPRVTANREPVLDDRLPMVTGPIRPNVAIRCAGRTPPYSGSIPH